MNIIRTQEEHFLTVGFKKAIVYIKPFRFDLSQLDRRDFSNFIQIAFEPVFTEFLTDLKITNVYINKALRPIFEACKGFVRSESNFASDYYCYGHIGLTHIQICKEHFFEDNWILFLMGYSDYGKVGTLGLIRRN